MFAKETYVQRRAQLKKTIGSGVLLFLGNDEQGLNYEDNTFRYRQDSTFLYYFGLSFAGLSALIDIDEDKEIIGYKFVNLGKMMESISKGMDANEALQKATGQYGRFDNAAKYIDPRKE